MKKDHFELLRAEHLDLQSKYTELRRKYEVLAADAGQCDTEGSFATSLLKTVTDLYGKDLFSDLTVTAGDKSYPGHRLVIASRTQFWKLADVDTVEIDGIDAEIAEILLRWMYTDCLDPDIPVASLIPLTTAAIRYKLGSLTELCVRLLTSRLDVDNVVSVYEFAETQNLADLREKCSTVVAARWSEFGPAHFAKLSAPLLYRMLKSQSAHVLHAIVELAREDVLFLYFIENDSKLETLVNQFDLTGRSPLELSLRLGHLQISDQLVQHEANVDIVNEKEEPLIVTMVRDGIHIGCNFLSEHGVDLAASLPDGTNLVHVMAQSPTVSREIVEWAESLRDRLPLYEVDKTKRSPLLTAQLAHNSTVIDFLLSSWKGDLNIRDSEGNSPLLVALFNQKSLKVASQLIAAGADVNLRHTEDYLLHHCVEKDNLPVLDFLLENGASVELPNAKGQTPLHVAVTEGRVDAIGKLLKKGANSNGCVRLAIEKKQKEAARALIGGGANANEKDDQGMTPLLASLLNKDDESAVFLLESGASYTERDPSTGASCLELSVISGLQSTLRSLCASGVDINERVDGGKGFPVIVRAFENDHFDCASILITFGCDVEGLTDVQGVQQTLLHRALDMGWQKAAVLLIESGCDLNSRRRFSVPSDDDALSPLHMAVMWQLDDVVPFLVSFGTDLDAQDSDGRTACHLAVREQNDRAVDALLAAEVVGFLAVRDRLGHTPLSLAIATRQHKIAAAMVARQPHAALQCNGNGENLLHSAVKGNDLESVLFLLGTHTDASRATADTTKRTVLHLAAEFAEDEMILRNLLLAGCDVNVRAADGSTPLHVAARCNHPNHVSILLDNGANPNIVDAKADSPLHVAISSVNVACVRTLLEESNVDARAVNKKGQSPLHVCALASGAVTVEMCEMILCALERRENRDGREGREADTAASVDSRDLLGNTPLLLSYMSGNAGVCRLLLRRGASMGARNCEGISLFNYDTPTKQLLFGLLETLEREPRWSEGDWCSDCEGKFSLTTRKHHCRHCGRVVCAKCSETTMPIVKFGEDRRVRVCTVCAQVLTMGAPRS